MQPVTTHPDEGWMGYKGVSYLSWSPLAWRLEAGFEQPGQAQPSPTAHLPCNHTGHLPFLPHPCIWTVPASLSDSLWDPRENAWHRACTLSGRWPVVPSTDLESDGRT